MKMEFCNGADDVQWLKETHLKGVPGLPEFNAFVIVGNEDAPESVQLYESADPLYTDRFMRVTFGDAPIYCTCEWT